MKKRLTRFLPDFSPKRDEISSSDAIDSSAAALEETHKRTPRINELSAGIAEEIGYNHYIWRLQEAYGVHK